MAKDYAKSPFIDKVDGDYVDFVLRSRPVIFGIVNVRNYRMRTKIESIARHIPRKDAKWLGERLSLLSQEQIEECFRAGGFTPDEVALYTHTVMDRIQALTKL